MLWMSDPPRLEQSPAVKQGSELFLRDAGPLEKVDLSSVIPKRKESYEPSPYNLTEDNMWFFPALAYSLMGMDRSLFDLFSWGYDKTFTVKTYKTDVPVALLEGIDITSNPWFYTVQGVPMDDGLKFLDYISTFKFNDNIRNRSWCIEFRKVRISDPFSSTPRGVDLMTLLPKTLDKARAVTIVREPSLTVGPLVLGIRANAL